MKRVFFLIFVSVFLLFSKAAQPVFADSAVIADGKTVSFDYTLTVDGAVVDSSQGKKPLEYVHGQKKIIPGLEKQLVGLKIGDEKKVVVSAEEAYGKVDPNAIQEVDKKLMPQDMPLSVGAILEMKDPSGNVFPCKVKEIKENSVMMDFNHPLAGKELTFQIKIVDIK